MTSALELKSSLCNTVRPFSGNKAKPTCSHGLAPGSAVERVAGFSALALLRLWSFWLWSLGGHEQESLLGFFKMLAMWAP